MQNLLLTQNQEPIQTEALIVSAQLATSQKKGSSFSPPKEKISIVIMIVRIKVIEKTTMFNYLEALSFILLL